MTLKDYIKNLKYAVLYILVVILMCCLQVQYAKSSAYQMSTALDIPPVSGSIIWARQVNID